MWRFSGGSTPSGDEITCPSISIVPVVGAMNPAIMRKVVVLPQPDGPSSDTNSPSGQFEVEVVHGVDAP